ncbi:MAG: hypothetical protein V4474_03635 [Patescibacteria group bacterium]
MNNVRNFTLVAIGAALAVPVLLAIDYAAVAASRLPSPSLWTMLTGL